MAYFFQDIFGRRRKRSGGCGIPSVIPKLNIDIEMPDLSELKNWAKSNCDKLESALKESYAFLHPAVPRGINGNSTTVITSSADSVPRVV